jgi:hypothetical protein
MMFYADAWHIVLLNDCGTYASLEFQASGAWAALALTQFHRFKEFKWMPITSAT